MIRRKHWRRIVHRDVSPAELELAEVQAKRESYGQSPEDWRATWADVAADPGNQ